MPKYTFKVNRVSHVWTYVESEAETEDEAYEKVCDMARNNQIAFNEKVMYIDGYDINCYDVSTSNV